MRIGIALGSNVGDRLAHLRHAVDLLVAATEFYRPLLRSAIYEAAPVNMPAGTQSFLNAVVEMGSELSPEDALEALTRIELKMGRPARRPKNLSRIIDLDLLYQDANTLESPRLELPHPRMLERAFVLRPLADIRPDLVLPGQTVTVLEILTNLRDATEVRLTDLTWK